MGAYSPLPWLPAGFVAEVERTVAMPTILEMARLGTPFVGLLYCGLIVTERGIRVIEFNARFGDPETQVVLGRLESSLEALLLASATGKLDSVSAPQFSDRVAVAVVLASEGYPDNSAPDRVIGGIDEAEAIDGVEVCVAAAREQVGELFSNGGRVLSVVATGDTFHQARKLAYQGICTITLEGSHYRTDIAAKVSN
jgi:phosphoribosylamine--glycine ligase